MVRLVLTVNGFWGPPKEKRASSAVRKRPESPSGHTGADPGPIADRLTHAFGDVTVPDLSCFGISELTPAQAAAYTESAIHQRDAWHRQRGEQSAC